MASGELRSHYVAVDRVAGLEEILAVVRHRLHDVEHEADTLNLRLDKLQAEHDELEIFTTILLGGMILALLVPYAWVVGAVSAASVVLVLWQPLTNFGTVVRAWAAVWVVQPVREALSLYRPGGEHAADDDRSDASA